MGTLGRTYLRLKHGKEWLYSGGSWFGGRIGARSLRAWKPPPSAPPGVNFIGPVEFLNGLGVSARGYVAALMNSGVVLNVVPWRYGFERLQSMPVRYPSAENQPINIIHLNLDLLHAERLLLRSPLAELMSSRHYNILIFSWELDSLVPDWVPLLRRFDEIWCATSFMAQAAAIEGVRPVKVVRPAVVLEEGPMRKTKADFGLPQERFSFFYSADYGSVLGRKNPHAFLRAYREEFAEDEGACCLLKIHYGLHHKGPMDDIRALMAGRRDIILLEESLDGEEMRDLYRAIDCYVSPHRSEGLGLTILEAMLAKKPVIATPYGGVTDFVNVETTLPLSYRLLEVGAGNAPYPSTGRWADPDISCIRSAMRLIFQDRTLVQDLAESGRRQAKALFSAAAAGIAMQYEIERIWRRGH